VSEDFAVASAVERVGELEFRAHIPDGWQQGRGAFGGLVLGTLLRAIEAAEPDRTRAARTLAGDLCGPVLPGPADVRVRVLRRGSNQSNLAAELRQDGAVLATATAVLSPPRPSPSPPPPLQLAPPPLEDPAAQPVAPLGNAFGPTFAAHYEYRSSEPLPFVAATGKPSAHGWVRERAPLARVDAPALVARLDAWWPALFNFDGRPRPMATVSFVAELLADPATLPPDEPLRYQSRMATLNDGFCVELRELWRGERVIALNQQTFAIIK
jgi:hypothetical protein